MHHNEDSCKKCHGLRACQVELRTGRYSVMLPSVCPSKDGCEAEILQPFSRIERDGRMDLAGDTRLKSTNPLDFEATGLVVA